jgi:Flp pilus assembly pilin Flp
MLFLTELLGTKAALAFAASVTRHSRGRTSVLPREQTSRQEAAIDRYQGEPGKEKPMLNLIAKLAKDESGQDLAEYGIALAVVAVAAATAALAIKGYVGTLWQNGQSAVSTAVGS